MRTWNRERIRHAATVLRQGRNPAAVVYDSVGADFFLALDEGWLNLGLWEGDGTDPAEAPVAVRRLVRALAAELPPGGAVLDVGNGLGVQDPLILEASRPSRLVAVNITRSQLVAGRPHLVRAGALAVTADAAALPIRSAAFDGVISVEAAFHFRSRRRFLGEAFRVLRPGGVVSMSDVPIRRMPRSALELIAGASQLRVWGLRREAAATAAEIGEMARAAGFVDVWTSLVGDRVIGPALRFTRRRLEVGEPRAPLAMRLASRVALAQAELLWERGVVDYLLLRATKPA